MWTVADYKEAYEGGASIADIAMVAGKGASTIRYHLLKQGVILRPKNPVPMKLTDKCSSGHDLSVEGKDRDGRVFCLKCDRERKQFLYDNDLEFREVAKKRSRDHKRKKKANGA